MSARTYLDWNATTPLRAEAREAMYSAMDIVGNASSVHSEGRKAKALIEKARAQVASALGADGADVIFTSGATEAAALALEGRKLIGSKIEHDAVAAWIETTLTANDAGRVLVSDPAGSVLQLANSETGVVQDLPSGLALSDVTQAFGKIPFSFHWLGCTSALVSAHKLGGPKGIGALVVKRGTDVAAKLKGGGQEMGRRAGTENLVGIVGFGAAAEAASRDLAFGVWDEVAENRDFLEMHIADAASDTIFAGKFVKRLPNTTCLISEGWKGETQVMQMDLAGFAISAGSACSSGKVRASKVLQAYGFSDLQAASAIRVSIGPETTRDQLAAFADAWLSQRNKQRNRAA